MKTTKSKCGNCGMESGRLKVGWTNDTYCSYSCELEAVSQLHGSMPGAGPLPRPNWVPHHIGDEIRRRWEE